MPERLIQRNFNIKMGETTHFLKCESLLPHDAKKFNAVNRFKFNEKTAYARKYATVICDFLDIEIINDYDTITFVPMTYKKESDRGFNQAELFAKSLSKIVGVPYEKLLYKVKESRIQHELSAKDRAENVKGVYKAEGEIMDKNIILVDDIITTGSTLCECTKELYLAGAKHIKCICMEDTSAKQI